jgi:Domain of unknown function (DUF4129)
MYATTGRYWMYWVGSGREKPPVVNGERQATQPQTKDRLPWAARYARPALVGLMLVVVLAGVRAARPAGAGTGPWHRDVLQLAGVLEVVLAVLLVALWLLTRRRPRPGYPASVLRAGLLRVIALAMAAVAILAGISRVNLQPERRKRTTVPPPPKLSTPRGLKGAAAQNATSLTYLFYALLALLLVAAIVVCVLVIRRRVPAGSAGDVLVLADDDDASMRDAIDSGRRALRAFDDAQAAIIACYVAMEASLASAGTAREVAETPDELLGRAVASRLLQGSAAGRLTALFYEARYSSHALPATARDEASRALDAISAELTRREDGGAVSMSGPSAQGAAP